MNQPARKPFQPVVPQAGGTTLQQTTAATAPATRQPSNAMSLIQRFGAKFGCEPEKVLATLRATAFRQKAKSGQTAEQAVVTNEQMMALLIVADQYGLNPFTKEIYAYPDNGGIVPVLGVDGWLRIINEHPMMDGMTIDFGPPVSLPDMPKNAPMSCTVTIYRKDRKFPTVITELLEDCYRPVPVYGDGNRGKPGPWQSHTTRMLQWKGIIQCGRVAFGFSGMHDEDDADSIVSTQQYQASEAAPQRLGVEQLNEHLKVDTSTGEVLDVEFVDPVVDQERRRDPEPEPAQRTQRTRAKATAPAETKPKPPTQGVQAQGIGPGEVGTPGVEHREPQPSDQSFDMGD